jgi:hypothetical protein
MRHGQHRKRHKQFIVAARMSLSSCYLATREGHTNRPTDSALMRHGPHRKRHKQFNVAARMSLSSCYLATTEGHTVRPTDSALIRHGPHKKCQSYNSSIVECIRCHGNVFTEPLPNKERRDIHRDTQTDGRYLWSTPLRWAQLPWLYIPNFIKIDLGI